MKTVFSSKIEKKGGFSVFEVSDIMELLGKIGATMNYKGYAMLLSALQIVDPLSMTPFQITKDLYPEVAKRHGTSERNVEHDLRHLLNHCWEYGDPKALQIICGEGRTRCPSNAEFIALLSSYLYRKHAEKSQPGKTGQRRL